MKIVLIAPTPPDVAAFGIRTLSSYLKSHGKDVRCVFLPSGIGRFMYKKGYRYQYRQDVLDQVVELSRDADLIGISFMSNYLDRASQLGETLRKSLDIPVIMGGIHPTVMPEQTLEFADIVCVGEGEEALLELVERMEVGRDFKDVRNLCFKENGNVIKNPIRPLIQDLDSIPFFDFGLENHFIFNMYTEKVEPMSMNLLEKSFSLEPHVEGTFYDSFTRTLSYKTMTTRGCPHHCTYCAENTLKELYRGEKYLRKRSVNNIIEELLIVKEQMPFVESIFLFDDTFLVRTDVEIKKFAQVYKEKIGLPFHVQASPTTMTVEKMDALVDAGLSFVEMGIQSTSKTSMELYRRSVSEKRYLRPQTSLLAM